jgi:hypothetical protein
MLSKSKDGSPNGFCTRPSRLFAGDPTALFAPDTQFRNWGQSLPNGLSSPFAFQIDTEPVPDSQFWSIAQISFMFFCATSNLSNFTSVAQPQLFLCPNNLVGSRAQDPNAGHLSGINPTNLGVALASSGAFGFLNDTNPNDGGLFQNSWAAFTPIVVPPKWFLRLVFFDNGGGALVLPPGTTATLRAAVQVIPINFTEAP